jgi:hypothetical protein
MGLMRLASGFEFAAVLSDFVLIDPTGRHNVSESNVLQTSGHSDEQHCVRLKLTDGPLSLHSGGNIAGGSPSEDDLPLSCLAMKGSTLVNRALGVLQSNRVRQMGAHGAELDRKGCQDDSTAD